MKNHRFQLPAVFSDGMVLQAGKANAVWGWATPGEPVRVQIGEWESVAETEEDGCWRVTTQKYEAGLSLTMEISCGDKTLTVADILTGEVWLCSGQSNMEWPLCNAKDGEQEIAAAACPQIRFFTVPQKSSAVTQHDTEAAWVACTPETARAFSAVAYHFGRSLVEARKEPVGLILAAWGGTPAEAWTPWNAMADNPDFADFTESYRMVLDPSLPGAQAHEHARQAWAQVKEYQDPGNRAFFRGWADLGFDDSAWPDLLVPGYWQHQGVNYNGAIWYRRTVTVPKNWAKHDLELDLGVIDDLDTTYFNGVEIGATGRETEKWWEHPRLYKIPAHLVRPGEANTIAVRIFDLAGLGGFVGVKPRLLRDTKQDADPISLDGPWKSQVEYGFDPVTPAKALPLQFDAAPDSHLSPATLYNGMIAPIVPFGLRGVIWYQGESNENRPAQYAKLFPTLIKSWRVAFENSTMPFAFVLLAGWRMQQVGPFEGGWATLRHAQLEALKLPATGVASAIDLGDPVDIHPTDKKPVGQRLALVARTLAYRERIPSKGPELASCDCDGNKLWLAFRHADGGLKAGIDGAGPLRGFGIHQQGIGWRWAEIEIHGDRIALFSTEIPCPDAACYGWASNPVGNLYNGAGLPAVPFCTNFSFHHGNTGTI